MVLIVCSVEDCAGIHYAKGLCHKHYQRQWKRGSVEDRPRPSKFDQYVDKSGECWFWTGPLLKAGYGKTTVGNRTVGAHRAMWERTNGPIPEGLQVLHHCDNRACVRPDHLYLGTHQDNMRDMAERKRARNGNEKKTHCPQGHPYSQNEKRRWCQTCTNASTARTKARAKERD